MYDFLILACTKVFLLTTFLSLLTRDKDRGGIPGEDVVLEGMTTNDGSLEATVVFSGTDNCYDLKPLELGERTTLVFE